MRERREEEKESSKRCRSLRQDWWHLAPEPETHDLHRKSSLGLRQPAFLAQKMAGT